ncbi:MAG: LysR family transcriptional regulator [Proteobacteria bacterium]|nr:LysR family transcriptional regulator [Pseudomonadota bacterium]
MQDLNDLYYFVQVVDHGGFAPAGRALHVPKSKLSRRIALLERRLSARLIQRSTRRFAVTELGRAYYAHCKAMLVEAEAAQTVIDSAREQPCGTVHVSCPVALLHAHVGAMIVEFVAKYPSVNVELVGVNRAVDLLAEGIDLALRVRPLPLQNTDLAMRVLAHASQCLVASPKLIKTRGEPQSPADLTGWPSLGHGSAGEDHVWKLLGPNGAEAAQHHTPRLISTDMVTLRDAAVAGIGVVQLPTLMIREPIAAGDLARVLPDWAPRRETIHVAFPTRRGLIPAVRGLIDHLADRFSILGEL